MAKDILNAIKQKRLYFDGGTGTVLQEMGLENGMPPEEWNLLFPEKVIALHKEYIKAGANIIKTNTFGINCLKYPNYAEMIEKGMNCAKEATKGTKDTYIAFDMGPSGKLLKPLGSLDFEDAVEVFAKNVRLAEKYGADVILIETMNDSFETKAAVLAAKENTSLPIFVTNVYDENKKLMTGASPKAMIAMLESMGVSAIGVNCSLGPDKMFDIVEEFCNLSSVPIIVNPNAGLPVFENGKTVFDIDAEEFSEYMLKMANMGATILGGCCGTTPAYIKKTVEKTKNVPYSLPDDKNHTLVSSYTHAVQIGEKPLLIGERINPTGKPRLKEALKNNNIEYLLTEAVRQEEAGVSILDVNVGLPEIDEKEMLKSAVYEIQKVTSLPLQLDSASIEALDASMRIYNGKPLVNSVSGEQEKMDKVFPLVKKYGGAVIALTIDENGIPDTAEERLKIAERIALEAKKYGIGKKDIIVDPLVLTVSSDTRNALTTLKAVRLIKENGFAVSLGVSNISFGLPEREKINSTFFALALENGLDCAIMNPFSKGMMDSYYSFNLLNNMDFGCEKYIEYASKDVESKNSEKNVQTKQNSIDLKYAIEKGMKEAAGSLATELLKDSGPLEIISQQIIPALNKVGVDFEEKKAFLPQLLMSAEAATAAFDVIKEKLPKENADEKRAMVLATVKGDIHDIGKNIVKVLMESYGFRVFDLGKDVEPQAVLDMVKEKNCKLVGLSALMTTTVGAMEETIKLLHKEVSGVKVIVGGAVLNKEYAKMINADFYAKDAMETVRISQKFYK